MKDEVRERALWQQYAWDIYQETGASADELPTIEYWVKAAYAAGERAGIERAAQKFDELGWPYYAQIVRALATEEEQ